MRKFLAVTLAMIMVFSLVVGCSKKEEKTVSKKTIMVNGKVVSDKFYDYYLAVEKLNNPDADEKELDAVAVKNTARQLYIREMCAENGIEITENLKNTVQTQIDYVIEQYGSKDDFVKEIGKYGLDYDAYYSIAETTYLESLLKPELAKNYTEEERRDFYNNHMINVQHILFTTVDQNQIPLDSNTAAEKKKLAESVLAEIKNGADFMTLVGKYNEDPGLNENGYMMSKYTMFVKPFLNAALELEENEVTELVETSYGYHIIKRYNHVGNDEWYQNSTNDINDGLFEQKFEQWYEKADIVVK